jgi:hypothetical protein
MAYQNQDDGLQSDWTDDAEYSFNILFQNGNKGINLDGGGRHIDCRCGGTGARCVTSVDRGPGPTFCPSALRAQVCSGGINDKTSCTSHLDCPGGICDLFAECSPGVACELSVVADGTEQDKDEVTSHSRNTVHHNVIWRNGASGILVEFGAIENYIHHNVIFESGVGIGLLHGSENNVMAWNFVEVDDRFKAPRITVTSAIDSASIEQPSFRPNRNNHIVHNTIVTSPHTGIVIALNKNFNAGDIVFNNVLLGESFRAVQSKHTGRGPEVSAYDYNYYFDDDGLAFYIQCSDDPSAPAFSLSEYRTFPRVCEGGSYHGQHCCADSDCPGGLCSALGVAPFGANSLTFGNADGYDPAVLSLTDDDFRDCKACMDPGQLESCVFSAAFGCLDYTPESDSPIPVHRGGVLPGCTDQSCELNGHAIYAAGDFFGRPVAWNSPIIGAFAPQCGNDRAEAGEVCDGNDLGSATDCTNCGQECSGFVGGVLGCSAACDGFDTSACLGSQSSIPAVQNLHRTDQSN